MPGGQGQRSAHGGQVDRGLGLKTVAYIQNDEASLWPEQREVRGGEKQGKRRLGTVKMRKGICANLDTLGSYGGSMSRAVTLHLVSIPATLEKERIDWHREKPEQGARLGMKGGPLKSSMRKARRVWS